MRGKQRRWRIRQISCPWRRITPLQQMNAVECGATCLTMVLRYYGRYATIAEIHDRYGGGRDGLSAFRMVQAAQDYGLIVKALSLRDSNLQELHMPTIVHWEFNHFLVVEKWTPKYVIVADPASGRKRLTSAEFNDGFTGIIVQMAPGPNFAELTRTAKTTRGQYLNLRTYARRYLKHSPLILIQILSVTVIVQLFGLTMPLLTQVIINHIIPRGMVDILTLLGLGLLVLIVTQTLVTLLRSLLLIFLQTRIDTQMQPTFFKHMLHLPLRFFLQRSTGDILSRVSSNTTIRDVLSTQFISTFLDSVLAIVTTVFLFTQSWTYGIIVFTIGSIEALILLIMTPLARRMSMCSLEATSKAQSYTTEMLIGMTAIKAAGAEEHALTRWTKNFHKQLALTIRLNYLTTGISVVSTTVRMFAPFGLLWLGTRQVLSGEMPVGTMLALNSLAVFCLDPLVSLVQNIQQFQVVRVHLERLSDIMDSKAEQDKKQVTQPPRLKGAIQLKHVSFQYAPDLPPILSDITLDITAGQKIAIVGKTGSGKSTLGKILLGLCLPTQGEIIYDGIPLQTMNYQAVRSQFGVVLQEASIFSGTIRENITFQDQSLAWEVIVQAAIAAELHAEITQMPMGYETFVAESGNALSGGQRQRLALARALVRRPSILLLDEATSTLDVITERAIERNLATLNCTQILIAHRLSTIKNADLILVIDQGLIVERGTHTELLHKGGYYATLISHQLSSQEPIPNA